MSNRFPLEDNGIRWVVIMDEKEPPARGYPTGQYPLGYSIEPLGEDEWRTAPAEAEDE